MDVSVAALWMQAGAWESPRLLAAGGWTSIVWPGEGLSSPLSAGTPGSRATERAGLV